MPALPSRPTLENFSFDIIETGFDDRVRAIRERVFIQEQRVPVKEEFDELDANARHWLALVDGEPVGTVRLTLGHDELGTVDVPTGESRTGRLGRLAVLASHRRQGIGKALARTVALAAREVGLTELEAWVQTWAAEWYERLGYEVYGPEFDDAGIPHRRARLVLVDGAGGHQEMVM